MLLIANLVLYCAIFFFFFFLKYNCVLILRCSLIQITVLDPKRVIKIITVRKDIA